MLLDLGVFIGTTIANETEGKKNRQNAEKAAKAEQEATLITQQLITTRGYRQEARNFQMNDKQATTVSTLSNFKDAVSTDRERSQARIDKMSSSL